MFTNSKRLFDINVIFNKSNKFGILHDAELIKRSLSGFAVVKFVDPLEHPSISDINIHLEKPIYSFIPWSSYNIFVMNPEWYVNEAYDPYMKHFDQVITKEDLKIEGAKVLPWTFLPFNKIKVAPIKEFLYLLGGSKNKRDFAKQLLPFWKESYPKVHVYSVEPLNIEVPSNVILNVEDLSKEKRETLLQSYEGHICCSLAEGFGITAAEAEYVNAFTILNTLPVYIQDYKNNRNIAWIQTETDHNNKYEYGSFVTKTKNFELDLDSAMESFSLFNYNRMKETDKLEVFKKNLLNILDDLVEKKRLKVIPPLLDRKECPAISVITLIYNRRKFFDLAKHNMVLTDYPKNQIQWIIVDDSDNIEEQASDKIIQTKNQFSGIDIIYVPLLKKTPISQKRNIGIERSTNDIILFMDDDDHYPETSFRRRVAWLTKHPLLNDIKAVACTTIACYDLVRGISAVNCPPFDIPLGQRISEATLTFYKSWYTKQQFEQNIQVGEGESFIKGRESEVLEIPPQQIIVAFSHGKNTSSRRIPASDGVEPSCFWGFPREYLVFIHSLVGIKIV
jgi:hypothetical protein